MTLLKIALTGAPRTGKSELASALNDAARALAWPVQVVVSDTPAPQSELTSYNLVLLMGLEAAAASPPQNTPAGALTQEAADQSIRTALARAAVPYRVLYGPGQERLAHARRALESLLERAKPRLRPPSPSPEKPPAAASQPWVWLCDKCSDPQCEHRLLTGLLAQRAQAA